MAAKIALVFCAQALLIQLAFGQVSRPSAVSGSVAESSAVVNSQAASGISVASSGIGAASSGLGLGSSGLGAVSSGLGVASSGLGLATSNLANNAVNVASLGGSSVSGSALLSNAPGYVNLASLSGGGVLPVTSYSPLVPAGMTVVSDNAIEGQVLVNGQLPFLSAVAFEGSLNTDGLGTTSCGCGDGSVGIVSENYAPLAGVGGLGLGGLGGIGYGRGRVF